MARTVLITVVSLCTLARARHYEVYMTACDKQRCGTEGVSRSIKWSDPEPNIPLQLSKITYSADNKPLRQEALTPVQKGMGYIDVDTKRGRALFATKGNNSLVDTYVVDLNSSLGASGALNEPRLLIGDRSNLLAPCKNTTDPNAVGPCTDITTFYGRWSGDEILFSFEAWTATGELATAMGLGAVRADGTGARILTHDASVCPYGPCDETRPPELGFQDTCPTPLPGNRVLFTRAIGTMGVIRLAILDLPSGNVSVLDQAALVLEGSGCPSVDASGERVLYMTCIAPPYHGCDAPLSHTVGYIELSNPAVFVPGFAVPTVDAPNFKGTDATTMCAYDDPSSETFSCLGANKDHNEVLKLKVDQKTGAPDGEDDASFQVCMTASCYQAHVVEDVGLTVDDVVVV